MKSKKETKKLYSVLLIIDDFADDPTFSRQSRMLQSIFTRGRHHMISAVISTQKYSCVAPIIRLNSSDLFVFKLKNYKDMEAFVEETQALLRSKKELLDIYYEAIKAPYSFSSCEFKSEDH